jgi:hypothetical protein
MPVTYELHRPTIVVSLNGVYETSEVRAAILAAIADPRAAGATGLLFDVRHSASIAGRTATEVRAMADFIAANAERFGRRIALVAGSDAAFGLMRLGAVTVEQKGVDVRVFRDIADAEGWLAEQPGVARR